MRIKPNAYKDMWVYYNIDILSLLLVSATFCDHLHGGVLRRTCYKEHQNQHTNMKY